MAAPTCLAFGTNAGVLSVCRVIAPSIFLDPFAPPAPSSTNMARLHRDYESSDSCSAALRIHTAANTPPEPPSRTMNTDLFRAGLSASCTPTSDRSGSNHPPPPSTSRVCVSCSGSTTDQAVTLVHHASRDQRGTSTSPLASRLVATKSRIEFTFVPDRPFAFRCSPPRLAATQFRSATGSNSNLLTGTHTPRMGYTCRRTGTTLRVVTHDAERRATIIGSRPDERTRCRDSDIIDRDSSRERSSTDWG